MSFADEMLALTFCNRRGPADRCDNDSSFYTGVWDCIEYRRKTRKSRRNDDDGSAVWKNGNYKRVRMVDPFYYHFCRLPYEMQLSCLSHCRFHTLANPALWRQVSDRYFYKKLMMDDHVRHPSCAMCYRTQAVDLNVRPSQVYIGVAGYGRYKLHYYDKTTVDPDTHTRLEQTNDRFGQVNRYPCFYYRRCPHFNQDQFRDTRALEKSVVFRRWRRLHEAVGSPVPLDEKAYTLLEQAVPGWQLDQAVPGWNMYPNNIFAFAKNCLSSVEAVIVTTLYRGMYYFELINYDWEEAMAAIVGESNRQHHFCIDPSHDNNSGGIYDGHRPRRFAMSLLFRRVCHPDKETNDRYITIGYFETNRWKNQRAPTDVFLDFRQNTNGGPDVIFNHQHTGGKCKPTDVSTEDGDNRVGDDEEDNDDENSDDPTRDLFDEKDDKIQFYEQMVFKHVAQPTFNIRVYKALSVEKRKKLQFYQVSFPNDVVLHSVQRNRNTIRFNVFVDIESMTTKQKMLYGSSLVRTVRSRNQDGYAFRTPRPKVLFNRHSKLRGVFNLFYRS